MYAQYIRLMYTNVVFNSGISYAWTVQYYSLISKRFTHETCEIVQRMPSQLLLGIINVFKTSAYIQADKQYSLWYLRVCLCFGRYNRAPSMGELDKSTLLVVRYKFEFQILFLDICLQRKKLRDTVCLLYTSRCV